MFFRVLLGVSVVLFATGCSRTEEISALCARSPELESSLVAVNEGLDNLGGTSSVVLQSSFAVLLDTLGVMLELPPPDAREHLEVVDRAYREVYGAMRTVYWDSSLAATDINVGRSIENLSRSDNVRALDNLKRFVEDWCARALDATAPLVAGDATTLPPPAIVVEPPEEYEYLFDDEPSALEAYGYLIAGSRGLVFSPPEAQCVGKYLTDAAQVAVLDDQQFEAAVDDAVRVCRNGVTTSTTAGGTSE